MQDEGHEARIVNIERRLDKIDEILEKVRNRLPIWATLAFSAFGGVLGYLLRR